MNKAHTFRPKPFMLIILDGWGHRMTAADNAIKAAATPYWHKLSHNYPQSLLHASGEHVGLPAGQVGNSEVGHLHLGAGRLVLQELSRINLAIKDRSFFANQTLTKLIKDSHDNDTNLHIVGLLSPGGVHSHEQHIHALLQLAAQYQHRNVYLHMFLDGRDTSPRSAQSSLHALQQVMKQLGCGSLVSIIGRFYAMDRNHNWNRTQVAYNLLMHGTAEYYASNADHALELAYGRGESDEFVAPTAIMGLGQRGSITANDSIIFANFRADRMRQLATAIIKPDFQEFPKTNITPLTCVSFGEYDPKLPIQTVFTPLKLKDTLAEVLSNNNLTQLHIAETEKYAHVSYFFNGGIEAPVTGETRIMIPSLSPRSHDLTPAMQALTLTEHLTTALNANKYDVIICNYANADMLGHTGNFSATVEAITTLDYCLSVVIEALTNLGGEAIITADHGNAELMFDHNTAQAHTAHTDSLVPAIYVGRQITQHKKIGTLADIAPSILHLLGITPPNVMTGNILFTAAL